MYGILGFSGSFDPTTFRTGLRGIDHRGLDQNGPIVGNPVEVNWFVASNSLGAFDMVVSEMMGFDWQKLTI